MVKRTLHFGNPVYLSTANEQLVVTYPEFNEKKSVPIEDIGIIVLEDQQITITNALLEKLNTHKVAVLTCNSKHMPSGLFLPIEGNSEQTLRHRTHLEASVPLRKQLWQQTVRAKILNQARVLDQMNLGSERLYNLMDKVKSGDTTNCEAQAASYYWSTIYGSSFVRGREMKSPNAQLNYGYAILRSVVARALVVSGLLPSFGIHHKNKYNAFCLADDIMEPYRPFVDWTVLQLHYDLDEEGLSKEHKIELLRLPQYDVQIEDMKRPLFHAVSSTTASLYKCFDGEIRKIHYPIFTV